MLKLLPFRIPAYLTPYTGRIKHAGTHVVYQALAVVIPFLFLPVITHYVSPDQYGRYALYMAVISFMGPLLLMGMDLLVTTDYFKHGTRQWREFLSTYLVLLAGGGLVAVGFFWAGHTWFEQWLGFSTNALILLGVISCLQCLMLVSQAVTMMEKRLGYQGLFVLGKVVIAYAVSVPMVIWVSATWKSLVLAQVAVYTLLACVGLWFIISREMLGLVFSWKITKSILSAAGPLIIFATAFNASVLVDRVFIRHFMTLHDVGIYTMAVTILSLGMLFFQAISRVWWPWVSKKMTLDTPQAKLDIVKAIYTLWISIVVMYVMIAIGGGVAIKILTSKQYVVPAFLPSLLAMSLMMNTILGFGLYFLIHAKRFAMVSALSLTMLCLAAGLNLLLIPHLGLYGVACANGIANLVGMVWCLTVIFKTIELPWGKGAYQLGMMAYAQLIKVRRA